MASSSTRVDAKHRISLSFRWLGSSSWSVCTTFSLSAHPFSGLDLEDVLKLHLLNTVLFSAPSLCIRALEKLLYHKTLDASLWLFTEGGRLLRVDGFKRWDLIRGKSPCGYDFGDSVLFLFSSPLLLPGHYDVLFQALCAVTSGFRSGPKHHALKFLKSQGTQSISLLSSPLTAGVLSQWRKANTASVGSMSRWQGAVLWMCTRDCQTIW